MREAGPIITSDFCPAKPGSYTRSPSFTIVDILGEIPVRPDQWRRRTVPLLFSAGLGASAVVPYYLHALLAQVTIPIAGRSVSAFG
jgi:hypothetical protein